MTFLVASRDMNAFVEGWRNDVRQKGFFVLVSQSLRNRRALMLPTVRFVKIMQLITPVIRCQNLIELGRDLSQKNETRTG